jgi:hypothetical protein
MFVGMAWLKLLKSTRLKVILKTRLHEKQHYCLFFISNIPHTLVLKDCLQMYINSPERAV